MTLVLGAGQSVTGPQTHVLIIGVGRYPHLSAGAGPLNFVMQGLGQLKSPPISARALADWFTGGSYRNTDAPLGSVELLLSDSADQNYQPPGANASIAVAAASMNSIEAAFNDWEGRCNTDANNIAIFYFCGHGLQNDSMLLLAEDFAANKNNPWSRAIDFTRTFRGMACNQAQTQYYVIDACRQFSSNLLHRDAVGVPLKEFVFGQQKLRTAPTLFATGNGLPAFGDGARVSRLTAALLKALSGGGAKIEEGDKNWYVDTERLGAAVKQLVDLENKKLKPDDWQSVDPTILEGAKGTRVLHVLSEGEVPMVSVPFACLPETAMSGATFYHRRRRGIRKPAPAPGQWEVEIPADVYEFGVVFQNGKFTAKPIQKKTVRPPVCQVTIEAMEA